MIPREQYLALPLEERFIKLNPEQDARAKALHKNALVIDLHTHILDEKDSEPFEDTIPRIQRSQVDCFVEAVAIIAEDFDESMRLLGDYIHKVEKHPNFVPAFCAQDILDAKAKGKQAIMFQLEPQTFGRNLNRIQIAYGLGIRMALLTFNTRTYIGDGCGERTDDGLSYFGYQAVERMNELRMLIDLSHCGNQTTLDTIRASKVPVLVNHAGARTLYPQLKRLKTNEVMKELANRGGVMGISAIPNQLSGNAEQGIEDMLNHFDYAVKLMGIDHVAIGLDNVFGDHVAFHRKAAQSIFKLTYIGQELNAPYLHGIESPEEWPNITRGLVARGYSDDDIKKIIGGNALRVIKQVLG